MSQVYVPKHELVGWDQPPTPRPESPWRERYGGSADPTFCESHNAEIGRYAFPPEGRVYIAIDGGVYNIGGHVQSHPGGAHIVNQYSGLDATYEFKRDHSNWEALLQGMTKVSHIVPTFSVRRLRKLRKDEVCVAPWIYKLTRETFVRGLLEWEIFHTSTGDIE
ncbi:hypothetical protein B0T18DRAFT_428191 [Schizothecium vesticola]|uniref:Cytochrome b5 heme-binding domain-containing protein n=1 Tax=Schizothecium vesticola TaxID=314040 RepID=A0AA40F2V0_9PEZI|nr:hypothetical protein B0T18DRAFT_428191 [Schizothecium vesticola]